VNLACTAEETNIDDLISSLTSSLDEEIDMNKKTNIDDLISSLDEEIDLYKVPPENLPEIAKRLELMQFYRIKMKLTLDEMIREDGPSPQSSELKETFAGMRKCFDELIATFRWHLMERIVRILAYRIGEAERGRAWVEDEGKRKTPG